MNKMTRIFPILFVMLFSVCMLYPKAMAISEAEIAAIEKETWCIAINSDVADLYPAAIQYTILDEDPIPVFKANLALLKSKEKTGEDPMIQLIVAWDLIFRKVRGNEVAMIAPQSENQFSMRSGEPGGKKWLVTKAAIKKDGSTFCWSIPIEVQIGKSDPIKLDEQNSLNLEKFL